MKYIIYIIAIASLLYVAVSSDKSNILQATQPSFESTCTIDRWIDGDTFVCNDSRHIRLYKVDAPECKKVKNTEEGGMKCSNDIYYDYMNSKYDDKEASITIKGASYERIVANVNIDGVDLSKDLQTFINNNK